MKKGALALLVHGGTENWSPAALEEPVRRRLPGPAACCCCRMPSFDPAEVHYAAVWKPQPGELAAFPNLRVIFNLGAGVDALMADRSLPDVPLVRVAVTDLTDADDGICRAACADAPPAGALLCGSRSARNAGRRNRNGRRARSRSASWGLARSAPMRPTCSSGSAFASRAGAGARSTIDGIDCFHGEAAVRRVPAADRYPGLPAAADTGDAARPQPRRCSRNSIAAARSARRC